MQASGGISLRGFVVLSAALLAILWVLVPAQYSSVEAGALKLTGAGRVTSTPDSGAVTFIIIGRGSTAAGAREQAAIAASAAKDALLAGRATHPFMTKDLIEGVDRKDITTELFTVNEETEWDREQDKMVHRGYKAANSFSLTLHDASEERLAEVIDAAVFAGKEALSVKRIRLFLSPKLKRRLTNDARRLALDDARDSAYMYAQELGAAVGSLTHFADHTVAHSTVQDGAGAPSGVKADRNLQHAYMMPKARTPVSMGQQAVSVTINAEYALYARAAKWPYVNR